MHVESKADGNCDAWRDEGAALSPELVIISSAAYTCFLPSLCSARNNCRGGLFKLCDKTLQINCGGLNWVSDTSVSRM